MEVGKCEYLIPTTCISGFEKEALRKGLELTDKGMRVVDLLVSLEEALDSQS